MRQPTLNFEPASCPLRRALVPNVATVTVKMTANKRRGRPRRQRTRIEGVGSESSQLYVALRYMQLVVCSIFVIEAESINLRNRLS